MKILIAYFSIGSSHEREANSLAEYLLSNYPGVSLKLLDFVSDFDLFHFKQIPNFHNFLFSNRFSTFLYDKSWQIRQGNKSMFYKTFMKPGSSALAKVINSFSPEIVVTTHSGAANILASYKLNDSSFILVSLLTDFGAGDFWPIKEVDFYITPSREMKSFLVQSGFPADKAYDFGLPLHPEFLKNYDKDEAYKTHGLSQKQTTLLFVMGGAAHTAYRRNNEKISEILEGTAQVKTPLQIIIATGKNKDLLESLKTLRFESRHSVRLLGYLSDTDLAQAMSISDLTITKAGGLTISEALASNSALLLIKPFWGQERANADFMSARKVAFLTGKPNDAIEFIATYAANEDIRKDMLRNVKELAKPESTKDISKFLVKIGGGDAGGSASS